MSVVKDGAFFLKSWKDSIYKKTICTAPPVRVWVEPTNICNFKCKHCLVPQRKKGVMELELFKDIIDDIATHWPNCEVGICGEGEPLVNRNIFKMLAYCGEKGIKTVFPSNCSLWNKEKIDLFLENPADLLQPAIKAFSEEKYTAITGKKVFNKVIESILTILLEKTKRNLEKPKIELIVLDIVQLKDDILAVKDFFSPLPVDRITIKQYVNFEGELDLKMGGDNSKFTSNENKICDNPWKQIKINIDGSVNPCLIDFHSKFVAGNVKNQSITEIWNNELVQEFRHKALTNAFIDTFCGVCNCRYLNSFNPYDSFGDIFYDVVRLCLYKTSLTKENKSSIKRFDTLREGAAEFAQKRDFLLNNFDRWPDILKNIQKKHGLA